MKTMTFQVTDELFEAFEQIAAKQGRWVEQVALEWLAKHGPRTLREPSDHIKQAAWDRLLRHAGAVDSGDAHSADNERIDADLARAYGEDPGRRA